MKNTIQILLGAALLTLTACSSAETSATSQTTVTAGEVQALALPEPGAPPAQYQARLVTLRLLGTQGEGAAASATLADTATWDTRTYRLGETVGRNLKLTAIGESTLALTEGSAAPKTLRAGEDLQVRVVEHEFDSAAVEKGQHQWSVKAAVLGRLLGRYGIGATGTPIEFAGLTGVKLGPVRAESALARLGFAAGDLIFEWSGQPVTAAGLNELVATATQSKSQVLTVKMARGASFWERAYVVE